MSRKGGFRNFLYSSIIPKIYALGACVVIIGAMFKILHLPHAGELLAVGLTTEAIIFFIAAFEPVHKDLDWERVYPELGSDYRGPIRKQPMARPTGGMGVTQQLDQSLEKAKIGPQLIENLGKGMRNLAESASRMGTLGNAALATNDYAQNVKRASQSLSQMNQSYAVTSQALTQMASASKDARAYHEQIKGVTKNLSALNAVYEMELKDANTHLKSMSRFYSNVSASMESIAQAGKNSEQFRDELSKLTSHVTSLNKIYGNMLSAMKG